MSQPKTLGLKGVKLQLLVTAGCGIGFSLSGYDRGFISGFITIHTHWIPVIPLSCLMKMETKL